MSVNHSLMKINRQSQEYNLFLTTIYTIKFLEANRIISAGCHSIIAEKKSYFYSANHVSN